MTADTRKGRRLDLNDADQPELPCEVVAERDRASEKAQREAARNLIAGYHQEQLRVLLEHVRTGFGQLDAGEIDEFELDDLIHRYKRAAKQLWVFCEGPGGQSQGTANALKDMRERGVERDWWVESARTQKRPEPSPQSRS